MLLIAFGTRPEWIKIRPVVEAIRGVIPYKLLFTGQHSSLVEIVAHEFPHIKLEIEDSCDVRLDSIVTSILKQIPEDMYGATHVMVQGDTTTVFAVALAAFHRQIPVVHLEAGLRTYDNKQPYPEEFNRQAVGSMADIHLCATDLSRAYLRKENKNGIIEVVGNTVLDGLDKEYVEHKPQVLVTMHRRENHENIERWFEQINRLANKLKEYEFIFPMHPNPNVVKHRDILTNVKVCDPMNREDLLATLKSCSYVITDSGGIQEESAFYKKPCIVCRTITERPEGLGVFSYLCKSPEELVDLFYKVKVVKIDPSLKCPYGDGNASQKILEILREAIR